MILWFDRPVKRRLRMQAYRSRKRTWPKKAGLASIALLGGLGVFWWLAFPPRAPVTAANKAELHAKSATNSAPMASTSNSAGRQAIPSRPPNAPAARATPAPVSSTWAQPPGSETIAGSVPDLATVGTNLFPRPVRDVAEAQIALARLGLSSGSVDGKPGPQTASAMIAFQRINHLPETGRLDPATREALLLTRAPYTQYIVTESDLNRLQPLSETWAGKAQQTALDYETVLELVAEKSRAHPELLRRLNPAEVFSTPVAGTAITVPDTELGEMSPCAFIRIGLASRTLEVFGAESNLLAHFPCSIAQRVEKRPAGELHIASIAPNPNYTFDPTLFPESPEASQIGHKLILPPGPNNPVGIAWIGLDKPGYGIHGTPQPEKVGRTESHGCFRLANWNADHLLKIVRIGTPVYVE
jgi:lipoprotein-anchoring transpeptidase ErfK/SrfK